MQKRIIDRDCSGWTVRTHFRFSADPNGDLRRRSERKRGSRERANFCWSEEAQKEQKHDARELQLDFEHSIYSEITTK